MFGGFGLGDQESGDNNSAPQSTSSQRKTTNDNVDDIFQQICSKMSTLSTSGMDNKEDMVKAFVSVLMCSEMEATFFLESASWNVANAVNVYLENKAQEEHDYMNDWLQETRKRSRNDVVHVPVVDLNSATVQDTVKSIGYVAPYKNVEVIIEGLDRAIWRAYVHSTTGQIYFLHIPSNYKQDMVPPGFADNPNASQSNSMGPLPIPIPTMTNVFNPYMIIPGANTGRGYFPPLSIPNSENNSANNSYLQDTVYPHSNVLIDATTENDTEVTKEEEEEDMESEEL